MRRICFTMERPWQLFDTARAKQHCRWHLEENSCTSLCRVRVSSTKKDQGRTKNQDPPGPNDLNPCESASETSETLKQQRQPCNILQCNQVSVQVLCAISRCDHRQNKPVGGEDAKMQTSEMRLILGIGCIRGHSSCSIGVCSTDPVALGRWYLLILESFDICPIAKLKWIYTDCNVLTCTSLAMPSRCFAEWRSGIWRYPGRALHSPSFVGCPSRSRLRCHPPSATRHPWRWNEFHSCFCETNSSASISSETFSLSVTWGCLASPLLQVRPASSRQSDDHCDWDPHGLCRLDGFKLAPTLTATTPTHGSSISLRFRPSYGEIYRLTYMTWHDMTMIVSILHVKVMFWMSVHWVRYICIMVSATADWQLQSVADLFWADTCAFHIRTVRVMRFAALRNRLNACLFMLRLSANLSSPESSSNFAFSGWKKGKK